MVLRASNILAAALLAICLSLSLAATSHAASAYWGANIGEHLTGGAPPYDMAAADKFESMVGKRMSLIHYSLPWADCYSSPCRFNNFPTTLMEAIRARGSIPVFGWASYSQPVSNNQPDFKLSKITNGDYDDFLRNWAAGARAWGHAFFLNFNWEMNLVGVWPYEEVASGNKRGDFVKMWRHVHDIFRKEGADNVTWVWCPNNEYPGSADIKGLYPGDDYVDWTCVDGYNWSHSWSTFDDVFEATYDAVQAIAPSKPLLIAETASTEKNGSKAGWITDMLTSRLPRRFPNVKGFAWFEQIDERLGENWTIGTSPSSQQAFRKGIASRYYAGATFADVKSPIPPLSPIVTKAALDDRGRAGGQTAACRVRLGKRTCSTRCVARRSKRTGKRVLVCSQPKRCVRRLSKRTGKLVFVCTRQPLIGSLAIDKKIRTGLSLPWNVRAANAPIRLTLNRNARVTLRFARREGNNYRTVGGAIERRLRKGARGVMFAGPLSAKTTLEPGRYRLSVSATDSKRRKHTVRRTFTLGAGF